MIYKARIPFTSEKGLKYSWASSSVMHGLIMENIDTEYAERIHTEQLRVFSQAVKYENDTNYWTISVFSDEAYEKLLKPVLNLSSCEVTQKNDTISLGSADIISTSYEKLFTSHYIYSEPSKFVKLETVTPASFKVNGSYINIPSPKLILSGIAKRFDKDCDIHETIYDNLFDEIEQKISFASFDLHSSSFPLEGIRIPAYNGSVTLKISGNETFCKYINMLCDYASFTGIGIKTALGMGQVRYSVSEKHDKEEII